MRQEETEGGYRRIPEFFYEVFPVWTCWTQEIGKIGTTLGLQSVSKLGQIGGKVHRHFERLRVQDPVRYWPEAFPSQYELVCSFEQYHLEMRDIASPIT